MQLNAVPPSYSPLTADSASSTPTSAASAAATAAGKTLGQDDFLKLLVAQLSTQNPMDPMKDTDFIAQMAQFSSLQETSAMATKMNDLTLGQDFLEANDLIGRRVSLTTSAGAAVTGQVTGMALNGQSPQIIVNGKRYDLTTLTSVSPNQTPIP